MICIEIELLISQRLLNSCYKFIYGFKFFFKKFLKLKFKNNVFKDQIKSNLKLIILFTIEAFFGTEPLFGVLLTFAEIVDFKK